MTTYKMKDVKVYIDGKEIGFGHLVLKTEEHFRVLEIEARKVQERAERFRDIAIKAAALEAPVGTYIGDRGYGKKKAQWKQEQRRFRK